MDIKSVCILANVCKDFLSLAYHPSSFGRRIDFSENVHITDKVVGDLIRSGRIHSYLESLDVTGTSIRKKGLQDIFSHCQCVKTFVENNMYRGDTYNLVRKHCDFVVGETDISANSEKWRSIEPKWMRYALNVQFQSWMIRVNDTEAEKLCAAVRTFASRPKTSSNIQIVIESGHLLSIETTEKRGKGSDVECVVRLMDDRGRYLWWCTFWDYVEYDDDVESQDGH